MTEADLALAKAFLLFSVAGYTITAANTDPQPRYVSQAVAGWAGSGIVKMTGDRATRVPSSISSLIPSSILPNQSGDTSSLFPLYLSQSPALFSERVRLAHVLETRPLVWLDAAQFGRGFSSPPSDQPLTLPPVLTEAGFQFQL